MHLIRVDEACQAVFRAELQDERVPEPEFPLGGRAGGPLCFTTSLHSAPGDEAFFSNVLWLLRCGDAVEALWGFAAFLF